jgi:hypothetical protein
VKFFILGKAFYCLDIVSLMHDSQRQTAIDSTAIHKHSACTALSVITPLLRAREIEVFPEKIQKSHSGINR